jgi:hypothetical protein
LWTAVDAHERHPSHEFLGHNDLSDLPPGQALRTEQDRSIPKQ